MNPPEATEPVAKTSKTPAKKILLILGGVGILVVIGLVVVVLILNSSYSAGQSNIASSSSLTVSNESTSNFNGLGDPNSDDPVQKGLALSSGKCTGTGSKTLGSAPMHPSDLSVIIPMGLLAAGHVTPIDHQYYWGKIQMEGPDMYDVLAPADGVITEIQYRDRSQDHGKVKGDYRVVITYSCTFFSYFDLATSMSADINKQLPQGWESKGSVSTNIPVKQGEVIAKMGGQSLDFAVWDTTKKLDKLLVPIAYNNKEPWKIVTVRPLDYFSDDVKTAILPYYARQVEPVDGQIDYDIDGKAVGNWFQLGTNGYAGFNSFAEQRQSSKSYWDGHFALVPNHIDPTAWMISSGNVAGTATQYLIKNPSITPDEISTSSGIVKYELAQISYVDKDGKGWVGERAASGIKAVPASASGTALVQLLETRKLKVEIFLNKSPSQVTGFTNNAKTYDRGDNATMLQSDTAF